VLRPAEDKARKQAELDAKRAKAQADADELKARRRAMGNMQFVGFLYKRAMLTEKVVHSCLQELLDNPSAEELECASKLLRTVGSCLEVRVAEC
jgi:translation initiation factor 4G